MWSSQPPANLHHNLLKVTATPRLNQSNSLYSIGNYVSYSNIPSLERHFAFTISSHIEPQSYQEATKSTAWRKAMQEELDAMAANNT